MKLVLTLFVVAIVVAYVSAAATPEIDPVEAEVKSAAVEIPVDGGEGKLENSKLQKRGLFGGWGWGGPGWGWGGGWGGWGGHGYYGWGYPGGYGWGWGGWGGFYY